MNPADLPLRDIHLPPAPPWWPPASGWWMLLALLMLLSAGWVWWRKRTQRRRSAIAQAHIELSRLCAESASAPGQQIAREISVLLRRVCISIFPRQQVASLTGVAWLQFLDQAHGDHQFSGGAGRLLMEAPYRPGISRQELEPVLDLCATWIAAVEKRRPSGKS